MTLSRFLPRTLVGQLMALLVAVLVIAQMINLALLVGVQRLQARSNAYTAAIDHTARLIAELPEDIPSDLPYYFPSKRGEPIGSYFLSADNMAAVRPHEAADALKGWANLPRQNSRFQGLLSARGLTPLQTTVSFLPISSRPPPNRGERTGGPPRGAPRDGASFETGVERRPPPPLGGPRQGNLGSPPDFQEIRLSAEVEPGVWFNALMPHAETESLTSRILLATALLLGLSLLAVWFFARRLSRPISNFARAAEQLGRGEDPQPLSETGPVDMRMAASAFNNMQTRVTRMLETQRTMLRAVGHDLRTPLTTLRLRAENIEDDTERGKVIATLQDMTVITEEILSWAKDASGTEELASVDLRSLLESLTDDYQDQGHEVSLEDFDSFVVKIRRTSIKRALQNLIDNALKFGNSAKLSVVRDGSMVRIHVDDTGSGVPKDQYEEILKPFVRLESSRNKETGGTGLGLSIANSIVQIHGGTLTFSERKPRGLRVTITIPI